MRPRPARARSRSQVAQPSAVARTSTRAGPARPRSAWCRGSRASSSTSASSCSQPLATRRGARRPTRQVVGVAAHLVERRQPEPAVERGVLDALGHHRPAGLLEPDDELVRRGRRCRAAACARSRAEHEVARRGRGCRGRSAARQPARALGRRRRRPPACSGSTALAGHDVGAVAVHRDEQASSARVRSRGGCGRASTRSSQRGEPAISRSHLGGLHVVDDQPLGLGDHVVEGDPRSGRGIGPAAGRAASAPAGSTKHPLTRSSAS